MEEGTCFSCWFYCCLFVCIFSSPTAGRAWSHRLHLLCPAQEQMHSIIDASLFLLQLDRHTWWIIVTIALWPLFVLSLECTCVYKEYYTYHIPTHTSIYTVDNCIMSPCLFCHYSTLEPYGGIICVYFCSILNTYIVIVRKQRMSWIHVLNCQNSNQCLNCQNSLR